MSNDGLSWGRPGRRIASRNDPIADMGVGNRRPLLIALALGLAVAGGLYLAWDARADAREAAAGDAAAEAAPEKGAYGSKPSPAQLREEVEQVLKRGLPSPPMRIRKAEDLRPADKPIIGI